MAESASVSPSVSPSASPSASPSESPSPSPSIAAEVEAPSFSVTSFTIPKTSTVFRGKVMGGLIEIPYVKQPWEQRTLKFNWAGDCQPLIDNDYEFDDDALSVKVYDTSGVDQSSSMVQGTPSRSGNYISATIKGGTDGEDYYCRLKVTLTHATYEDEKIEADLLVQVREKGVGD